MKTIFIAFVLAAMMIFLTACGTTIQTFPAPLPIHLPGPPSATGIDVKGFQAMFAREECSGTMNEAFDIDAKLVFWHREGNCPDNRYELALFGKTANDKLCSRHDSIAGPQDACTDESYRAMFTTIINNLDRSDLGLGPKHSVVALAMEAPIRGIEIGFEDASIKCFLGGEGEYVINTQQEYQRLQDISPADCGYPFPKVDFSKHTLLGKGVSGGGCDVSYERKVFVLDDPREYAGNKVYTYAITVKESGMCKKAAWSGNWILVRKIPPGFDIRFVVKRVRLY